MQADQVVADMVEEVLARQAAVRARWSGESFGDALGAVALTAAGQQFQELRDGPHGSERAYEWQENLVRSRAEARVPLNTDTSFTDTSFLENHLLFSAGFQSMEDGLWEKSGVYYGKEAAFQQAWQEQRDRWAP